MTTLSVISYIERINRAYRLIRMERTGSRDELAAKLRVSRRTINYYLEELRLMGAEIEFSRRRNTYYFANKFVLHATIEARIDADVLDDKQGHDMCHYNKHLKNDSL
ncbi:HTH domain-containing protein [Bacteroides fragilis]|uniref:HTH domain-containing protein n=1 Tax=Bacteroides fragilis TaxID=817 RepID=UPI001C70574D|nr:HTH domain-containing protein [Bacteroides fragilis]MBW9280317.1 HTH domain-containing protein [Bacteroides fragilis]